MLLSMGKKFLAPVGKKLLISAKKKIMPIIAERGSQVLTGGLSPKQAVRAAVKDSAKAMLGTTRKTLEEELAKARKKKKNQQRGRGLLTQRTRRKYKTY